MEQGISLTAREYGALVRSELEAQMLKKLIRIKLERYETLDRAALELLQVLFSGGEDG